MVARMIAVLWSLLLIAAFGPQVASAQNATSLQGTFVWDSTAGDDVGKALDNALAGLNALHRRFARGHLERTIQPYRTVTIEQDEATVSIATDSGKAIRAPLTGEAVAWTRQDGKRMRVSIVREDGTIRQTFTAEDEVRENVFRPSVDGRSLTMAVTLRGGQLRNPIRYELVYRRDR